MNIVAIAHKTYIKAIQTSLVLVMRASRIFTITSSSNTPAAQHSKYLFIANHQSILDTCAIFGTFSTPKMWSTGVIKFMTARTIYYTIKRPFLWSIGSYPTRRKNTNIIQYSKQLFDQGYSLFIFPEGRRTTRADSSPRDGVLRIAELLKDSDVQIVLIHIEWSKRGWRRHADVTFDTIDSISDMTPKQLMDRIYSL